MSFCPLPPSLPGSLPCVVCSLRFFQAQESAESSRAKLAEEEAASAEAKRARAFAEGELARTRNQARERFYSSFVQMSRKTMYHVLRRSSVNFSLCLGPS